LFAAGHLPAVAAQLDLTPAIVARTLVLNGVAGLLYGWLFWRRHLEAAMVAHACTHLGLAAWRLLTT
jgi:membrane protease YdiL (CAAX protease family)